jgi:hypothetical protein
MLLYSAGHFCRYRRNLSPMYPAVALIVLMLRAGIPSDFWEGAVIRISDDVLLPGRGRLPADCSPAVRLVITLHGWRQALSRVPRGEGMVNGKTGNTG